MEPEKYEVSLYVETPQQIRLADGSNAMTLAPVPNEILEDIELHYANISMFLAHPTNMTIDSRNNRAILCDSNGQPEAMKTLGRACNAALPNSDIVTMSRSILHVGLFHESAFSSQVNCPVVAYPSSITSNTATKTPIVNFIALPIGVKPAIPCKAVHRSSEFVVYAFAAVSVQTLLQLLRSIPSQDPRTNSSADAQGLWLVVQPPKSLTHILISKPREPMPHNSSTHKAPSASHQPSSAASSSLQFPRESGRSAPRLPHRTPEGLILNGTNEVVPPCVQKLHATSFMLIPMCLAEKIVIASIVRLPALAADADSMNGDKKSATNTKLRVVLPFTPRLINTPRVHESPDMTQSLGFDDLDDVSNIYDGLADDVEGGMLSQDGRLNTDMEGQNVTTTENAHEASNSSPRREGTMPAAAEAPSRPSESSQDRSNGGNTPQDRVDERENQQNVVINDDHLQNGVVSGEVIQDDDDESLDWDEPSEPRAPTARKQPDRIQPTSVHAPTVASIPRNNDTRDKTPHPVSQEMTDATDSRKTLANESQPRHDVELSSNHNAPRLPDASSHAHLEQSPVIALNSEMSDSQLEWGEGESLSVAAPVAAIPVTAILVAAIPMDTDRKRKHSDEDVMDDGADAKRAPYVELDADQDHAKDTSGAVMLDDDDDMPWDNDPPNLIDSDVEELSDGDDHTHMSDAKAASDHNESSNVLSKRELLFIEKSRILLEDSINTRLSRAQNALSHVLSPVLRQAAILDGYLRGRHVPTPDIRCAANIFTVFSPKLIPIAINSPIASADNIGVAIPSLFSYIVPTSCDLPIILLCTLARSLLILRAALEAAAGTIPASTTGIHKLGGGVRPANGGNNGDRVLATNMVRDCLSEALCTQAAVKDVLMISSHVFPSLTQWHAVMSRESMQNEEVLSVIMDDYDDDADDEDDEPIDIFNLHEASDDDDSDVVAHDVDAELSSLPNSGSEPASNVLSQRPQRQTQANCLVSLHSLMEDAKTRLDRMTDDIFGYAHKIKKKPKLIASEVNAGIDICTKSFRHIHRLVSSMQQFVLNQVKHVSSATILESSCKTSSLVLSSLVANAILSGYAAHISLQGQEGQTHADAIAVFSTPVVLDVDTADSHTSHENGHPPVNTHTALASNAPQTHVADTSRCSLSPHVMALSLDFDEMSPGASSGPGVGAAYSNDMQTCRYVRCVMQLLPLQRNPHPPS